MREKFHSELQQLNKQLSALCGQAADQMRLATRALLEADLTAAEEVLTEDTELDLSRNQCEETAQSLLALQAPVASELRSVLVSIYCADKIERMGDLARHVAEIVRRTHPRPAVPPSLTELFSELGYSTVTMAEHLRDLLADATHTAFSELNSADEKVDALHRRLMTELMRPSWPYGVPVAINVALLARFYERFADQTVSVARRLDFAITGSLPD